MQAVTASVSALVTNPWFILFGTALGLVGLALTWYQAREAHSSAEAAERSAASAMRRIVGFDASVSLFTAVEAMQGLTLAIRKGEVEDAISRCQEVRKIIQRFLSSGASVDALVLSHIGALAEYLKVLCSELLAANSGIELNIVNTQAVLLEQTVVLSGVCETLRQFEVTNNGR